jgi:uncharacterized protein YbaP (TraB family)
MTTRRSFLRTAFLLPLAAILVNSASARSCLWKVTSETGTLYLQGSVHVLKADNYPLAPAIEAAYTDSSTLVLEVDMREMTSAATQQKIMAKAMLPGGKNLEQILDADTYTKLNAAAAEAGLPIAALSRFKPWFATMTITLMKLQTMGFLPQHGLDTYFYGKAEADGKKVVGLEEVDFQIDLFDSLSDAHPSQFVTRALADLAVIEEDVAKLEHAWKTGDIDALGEVMMKSFADYPEFHQTFVLDRNERWLKRLNTMLEDRETFMVVVGAGHLSGPGGLLALLKKEGYQLEQL